MDMESGETSMIPSHHQPWSKKPLVSFENHGAAGVTLNLCTPCCSSFSVGGHHMCGSLVPSFSFGKGKNLLP